MSRNRICIKDRIELLAFIAFKHCLRDCRNTICRNRLYVCFLYFESEPRKTLFASQKLLHEILFLPLLSGKLLFFKLNYLVLGGEDGRNSFLLLIRCPWHLISLNDICI